MKIEIKKAELTDLKLLVKWRIKVLREVFELPPEYPTGGLERASREYYETSLAAGEHIACFALADGTVAGCGGLCVQREMPSPDNPSGKCGFLMNVYTDPPYRNRKIGETAVRWLINRAQDLGITKIFLETSDAGRFLYEKTGFVPLENMMRYYP